MTLPDWLINSTPHAPYQGMGGVGVGISLQDFMAADPQSLGQSPLPSSLFTLSSLPTTEIEILTDPFPSDP